MAADAAGSVAISWSLSTSDPAGSRVLRSDGVRCAEAASFFGKVGRHQCVRLLLLLVQYQACLGKATGRLACIRRQYALPPDLGERELDTNLGRRRYFCA